MPQTVLSTTSNVGRDRPLLRSCARVPVLVKNAGDAQWSCRADLNSASCTFRVNVHVHCVMGHWSQATLARMSLARSSSPGSMAPRSRRTSRVPIPASARTVRPTAVVIWATNGRAASGRRKVANANGCNRGGGVTAWSPRAATRATGSGGCPRLRTRWSGGHRYRRGRDGTSHGPRGGADRLSIVECTRGLLANEDVVSVQVIPAILQRLSHRFVLAHVGSGTPHGVADVVSTSRIFSAARSASFLKSGARNPGSRDRCVIHRPTGTWLTPKARAPPDRPRWKKQTSSHYQVTSIRVHL